MVKRDVVNEQQLVSPVARLILSRLKERGAGALSLGELAVAAFPRLSGLPRPHPFDRWDDGPSPREDRRKRDRRFGPRQPIGPIHHRLGSLGVILPGLEERNDWKSALISVRAALAELQILGYLVPVIVLNGVPDKWTLTARGTRASKLVPIEEWRDLSGLYGKKRKT